MFRWKTQGQKPANSSAGPSQTSTARGGRHALGAPRSEALPERAAPHPAPNHSDPDHPSGRTTTGRIVRFSDLRVAVKQGTVYDTSGGLRPVGPLSGARAHVNVADPDPRKTGVLSRALGQKAVTMIIHVEITVTVGGTVLTRSRDVNAAGTSLIRSAKTQAAEFNDLARHWPG